MIICVVGPTGVGKTLLSEFLAVKYNATIINADAMQVYKELNIGTAKIKPEEMCEQEHYLFDIKSPDEDYSVYNYQKDVRKILDENKDRNIIIVGGTGLYIKASLFNYEFDEIQERNNFEDFSNEKIYTLLKAKGLDEGVHPNNRQRIISKLNSGSIKKLKDELLYDNVYFIGLTTNRENLYNRINKRVDEMMKEGLLDEVKSLYSKYGKVKSLTTGIGYKELIDYIDGNTSLDDAISLIKQRSRKYAKRQYTWFNNQMNIKWFETDYDNFNSTIKSVEKFIENGD